MIIKNSHCWESRAGNVMSSDTLFSTIATLPPNYSQRVAIYRVGAPKASSRDMGIIYLFHKSEANCEYEPFRLELLKVYLARWYCTTEGINKPHVFILINIDCMIRLSSFVKVTIYVTVQCISPKCSICPHRKPNSVS